MFVSPAYAATGGAAAAPGGASSIFLNIAPLLLVFIIFYFLLIRPQQKRMKAHQEMLGAVKRNDVVVTSGGLIGKVTKVDENEVELEVSQGVRVRVVKSTLSHVLTSSAKPAND